MSYNKFPGTYDADTDVDVESLVSDSATVNGTLTDPNGTDHTGELADSTDLHTRYTDEEVEDVVAALIASDANLSWAYDDDNDELTISLSDSIAVTNLDADNATVNSREIYVQPTEPSSPSKGDVWIDTS